MFTKGVGVGASKASMIEAWSPSELRDQGDEGVPTKSLGSGQ